MANRPVRSSRSTQPIIILSGSDSDSGTKPEKRGKKRKVESGRAKKEDDEWADTAVSSEAELSDAPDGLASLEEEEQDQAAPRKRKHAGSARKAAKGSAQTASSGAQVTDWRRHAEWYHDVPKSLLSGGECQRGLLDWFEGIRERRGMPWRKRYDPDATMDEKDQRAYEVWVSEVMLQQTQVNTVIPFWKAWLERWPTITSLASATTEEVASAWRGLGYYRRARSLLAGAQRIAADPNRYHGRLPSDPVQLEKEVEGVGRYTAGAICSIAYGVTTPIIDGNIHRLLCRVLALHAPPTSPVLLKKLWAASGEMVNSLDDGSHPGVAGDWNQALMELGSQICKPVAPDCKACPLSTGCRAFAELKGPPSASGAIASDGSKDTDLSQSACGICVPPLADEVVTPLHGGIASVTIFPMKKAAKESREELTAVRVLKWASGDQEKWLMVKRPDKGLLAGLYEPPSVLLSPDSSEDEQAAATEALIREILATSGDLRFEAPATHGSFLHVFSHINMTYSVHSGGVSNNGAEPPGIAPSFDDQAKWLTADEIKHANVGTGFKKLWALVYGPALFGGGADKKGKQGTKKATSSTNAVNGKVVKKLAMPMMPSARIKQ